MSGERRSLIGRPDAAWAYETADWLSAVDREYKRPNATVMSSIGMGCLRRQTDRPKLIEDYSKPNSFPVPVSQSTVSQFSQSPVSQFPSFTVQFRSPQFPSPSFTVQFSQSPVSQSSFTVPVSQSQFPVPVSQFHSPQFHSFTVSSLFVFCWHHDTWQRFPLRNDLCHG